MIEIKGFVIMNDGELSVGISDMTWTVSGNFYFEDKAELLKFKKDLKAVWETYCCGKVVINTFDEIDEMNRQFYTPKEPL